jgi:endo-1,4-beta-D-glucanase Y
MTSSLAQRLVRVAVCALVISPLACREDPAPPGNVGGTGGGGTGGRGGVGGRGGSGGGGSGGSTGGTGGVVDASDPDRAPSERPATDGSSDGRVGDGGATGDGPAAAAMKPFYSHPMAYPAGTIRPSNCVAPTDGGVPDGGVSGCPQSTLDQAVAGFYDKWKMSYFRTITSTSGANCSGLSYVAAIPAGDFGNLQSLSELQGLGMLITVIMAGHDTQAQANFDAMFKYARKFKSGRNAALMSRDVPGGCPMTINNAESQTDGDLDIALALLMADKQWGSGGAINYLQEGRNMIGVIKTADMSPAGLPVLGDWVVTSQSTVDGGPNPDPKYSIGLRSSDLMPGHFRAFSGVMPDIFWMQAIDASHSVLKTIQDNDSTTTGLIPDFIVNVTTAPEPAPEDWSADNQANDGRYSYHAARVPLRLAADYLTSSGEPANRVKALITKLEDWISGAKTMGNPANIVDGYDLDGDNRGNGPSFLFEAPIGAAAVVDAKYQAWLNAIWARVSMGSTTNDSHGDSVRLLSLILMSGNWWAP